MDGVVGVLSSSAMYSDRGQGSCWYPGPGQQPFYASPGQQPFQPFALPGAGAWSCSQPGLPGGWQGPWPGNVASSISGGPGFVQPVPVAREAPLLNAAAPVFQTQSSGSQGSGAQAADSQGKEDMQSCVVVLWDLNRYYTEMKLEQELHEFDFDAELILPNTATSWGVVLQGLAQGRCLVTCLDKSTHLISTAGKDTVRAALWHPAEPGGQCEDIPTLTQRFHEAWDSFGSKGSLASGPR